MATAEDLLQVIINDQQTHVGILHADLEKLIARTGQMRGSGGEKKESVGFIGQIIGAVSKVVGVIGAVSAALLSLPGIITGIAFAATPFVNALSPSAVEAFHVALDGLKATIGEGLLPIISYATASIKEWAGILLPSIRELKPIIAELSAGVASFMSGYIRVLATGLSLLLKVVSPLVTSLAGWLNLMGSVLEIVSAVIVVLSSLAEVVDGLRYILEGPLFGILDMLGVEMKSFKDALRQVVLALVSFAAIALRLSGADETLKKFRDALAKNIADRANPPGGILAAPKDAGISGVDSILARMNERAFVATSGAAVTRTTDELLTDVLGRVDKIANDKTLEDTIYNAIKKALPGTETASSVLPVLSTVYDPSATSSQRAAAARAEGGGAIGASFAIIGGQAADAFSSPYAPWNW